MTQRPRSVSARVAQLAQRCGVALHYESFWHEEVTVPEPVLRQALAAMGVDPDAGQGPAQRAALPPIAVVTDAT